MIRIVALFLLALAIPAGAETARVVSGEHADFTRLVIELPADSDWTVGRTPMGYAFATNSDAQPVYDLARVWDRIPRTRLQNLRPDPENGGLQLTLACPCHVFPFQYRPGVIVLDIRDGPAPAGSVFEQPFAVAGTAKTPAKTATSDLATYDWLDRSRTDDGASAGGAVALPLDTGVVSLEPLRDELLEQISRGAVDGVVDMELPGKPKVAEAIDHGDLPWSRISIGEMPGIDIAGPSDPSGALTPDGTACITDEVLALSDWGADRPPLDLLVEARAGLYGEFDALDPVAVLRAIRLHLYLGFGAEAGQYATLLTGEDAPEDLPLYRSMARLIEGDADPETPFAGMLGCDGNAALWAALAYSRLPKGSEVNSDAILRGFLALPAHLRRSLGAGLSAKFLDREDAEAARMIRDAMERTPDVSSAEVALLDAQADLMADRPDEARKHAEAAVDAGGESTASLIALVEAHFREMKPLSPDVAAALRAFRGEARQGVQELALDRALVLAEALSGETGLAFQSATDLGLAPGDLWQVVVQLASDDEFLRHAVLTDRASVPETLRAVELRVAERLVDLGFADAALIWLGSVDPSAPAPQRLVAARAELNRGDARRAVDLLNGVVSPEAAALRATALVQLGSLPSAAEAYQLAGMTDEALRLLTWQKDWARIRDDGADPWSAAAAVVLPEGPDVGAGPLARGASLLDESAAARAALDALLTSVTAPGL